MSKTGIMLVGGLVISAVVYQFLQRVPADALNVALGVMCGIGASIPVSVGLLLALMRQRQRYETPQEWSDPEPAYPTQPSLPQHIPQQPALPQPQIIVLAPQGNLAPGQFPQGMPMPAQWLNQQAYPFMQEHANAVDAREWRIIGEE